MPIKSFEVVLSELSLDLIRQWADSKIVSRGRDYWNSGKVQNVIRLKENTVLATVKGSRNYTTMVQFGDTLHSQCTCPFGSRCKHAVALLYTLLELQKTKKIPELSDTDERLEHDNELIEGSDLSSTATLKTAKAYIQELCEKDAKELLIEMVTKMERALDLILVKQRLENGNAKTLWHEIRQQMESMRKGPDWEPQSRSLIMMAKLMARQMKCSSNWILLCKKLKCLGQKS